MQHIPLKCFAPLLGFQFIMTCQNMILFYLKLMPQKVGDDPGINQLPTYSSTKRKCLYLLPGYIEEDYTSILEVRYQIF